MSIPVFFNRITAGEIGLTEIRHRDRKLFKNAENPEFVRERAVHVARF